MKAMCTFGRRLQAIFSLLTVAIPKLSLLWHGRRMGHGLLLAEMIRMSMCGMPRPIKPFLSTKGNLAESILLLGRLIASFLFQERATLLLSCGMRVAVNSSLYLLVMRVGYLRSPGHLMGHASPLAAWMASCRC